MTVHFWNLLHRHKLSPRWQQDVLLTVQQVKTQLSISSTFESLRQTNQLLLELVSMTSHLLWRHYYYHNTLLPFQPWLLGNLLHSVAAGAGVLLIWAESILNCVSPLWNNCGMSHARSSRASFSLTHSSQNTSVSHSVELGNIPPL